MRPWLADVFVSLTGAVVFALFDVAVEVVDTLQVVVTGLALETVRSAGHGEQGEDEED